MFFSLKFHFLDVATLCMACLQNKLKVSLKYEQHKCSYVVLRYLFYIILREEKWNFYFICIRKKILALFNLLDIILNTVRPGPWDSYSRWMRLRWIVLCRCVNKIFSYSLKMLHFKLQMNYPSVLFDTQWGREGERAFYPHLVWLRSTGMFSSYKCKYCTFNDLYAA